MPAPVLRPLIIAAAALCLIGAEASAAPLKGRPYAIIGDDQPAPAGIEQPGPERRSGRRTCGRERVGAEIDGKGEPERFEKKGSFDITELDGKGDGE